MIFGLRRGVALAAILVSGFVSSTYAIEKHIVIPETVEAIDLNTGGPYYAPPVPGGHYTKDTLGHLSDTIHGKLGLVINAVKSLCANCGGSGQCTGCGAAAGSSGLGACNHCSGTGFVLGSGDSHSGHIHGNAGQGTTMIAANGTSGQGALLSGLHGKDATGHATFNGGIAQPASVSSHGAFGGHGKASPQAAAAPSGQTVGSPQSACANGGCGGRACGDPACHGLFGRKDRGNSAAGHNGCGTPGCTNPGCGLGGMFAGKGHGAGNGCGNPACTSCGNGAGMGHGAGHAGMGNGNDHGAGHAGLGSKLAGLFHREPKVKWFVGPGGPVPLTPGYVPYVNPIRSPRDYFAFPPYLDQAMQPGYGSMPQSTAGFATDKATTPTDFVAPVAKPAIPPPAPKPAPAAPAPKGADKKDDN